MTVDELAKILKSTYNNSLPGEKSTQLQLFGIKYVRELSAVSLAQVIEQSRIGRQCTVDINAGRRLARYVDLKLWP